MNEEIERIRRGVQGFTNKQLVRLHRRIWKRIDAWYGAGSWDWPTLRVVYPQFACAFLAIHQELKERNALP